MTIVEEQPRKKSRRGFAAMSPELWRELSSRGGKASQESGRAHRFTSEQAHELGRLGGLAGRGRSRKRVSVEEIAPGD